VEQNWILFRSEVLTAFRIRQFLVTFAQPQKASIAFIMSVCQSDPKYHCGSTGRIDMKCELSAFINV